LAGKIAIKKLNDARRAVSEIEGIKLEQQIEAVRKSLDEKVGNVAEPKTKVSVLAACGTKFQGHTYLVIIARGISWKDAKEKCEKMGGHLVYVETAEEMLFTQKLGSQLPLWVGAAKAKEGDWRWLNKKPVIARFWHSGYPQKGRGPCTMIMTNGNLCSVEVEHGVRGFICEWE